MSNENRIARSSEHRRLAEITYRNMTIIMAYAQPIFRLPDLFRFDLFTTAGKNGRSHDASPNLLWKVTYRDICAAMCVHACMPVDH